MPSFERGSRRRERWDVVFHLFAERWPPCAKPLPAHSRGRARRSRRFELGNQFGYGAAALPAARLPGRRRDEPIARPGDSSVEHEQLVDPPASVRLQLNGGGAGRARLRCSKAAIEAP